MRCFSSVGVVVCVLAISVSVAWGVDCWDRVKNDGACSEQQSVTCFGNCAGTPVACNANPSLIYSGSSIYIIGTGGTQYEYPVAGGYEYVHCWTEWACLPKTRSTHKCTLSGTGTWLCFSVDPNDPASYDPCTDCEYNGTPLDRSLASKNPGNACQQGGG